MSNQATSLNELDNLDVFDFFNLPKTADASAGPAGGQISNLMAQGSNGLGPSSLPDPESDWLRYGTPYT